MAMNENKKVVFKMGDKAENNGLVILVTGDGDKSVGYPCFAGVVVKARDNNDWHFGFYSDTWTEEAFKITCKTVGI